MLKLTLTPSDGLRLESKPSHENGESSMQLEIQSIDEVQRRVDVSIPADTVDQAFRVRFSRIRQTARISGFRKGKIPQKVINQRYGASVQQEVMEELLQSVWMQLLSDGELSPLGRPELEGGPPAQGQDYQVSFHLEVEPPIELGDLKRFQVEQTRWEIDQAFLDEELEQLHFKLGPWRIAEEGTESAAGDQIKFSLRAFIDGEERQDLSTESESAVLGGQGLLPELEESFTGIAVGTEVEATVQFPEGAPPSVAGQEVSFKGTLLGLERRDRLSDEALVQQLEVADMDAVRAQLSERLLESSQREATQSARTQLIEQIQALDEFPLPPRLLDEQTQRILNSDRQQAADEEPADEDEAAQSEAEERAKQMLRREFFLNAVAESASLSVGDDEVERHVRQLLTGAGQIAPQLAGLYQKPEMRKRLQATLLDEKVLDYLLERVEVTENVETLKGPAA